MDATPHFVTSPHEIIASTRREKVTLGNREFWIEVPERADDLFSHPTIQQAHQEDEYMPYWPQIWPVARMLGKALLKEDWSKYPKKGDKLEALELGCGLGVPGIAALSCGLRVTFSDYDLAAIEFATRNARLNRLFDFKMLPLDWRFPPDDLTFPIILGADITYEERSVEPILKLLKKMLTDDGTCFLTDQNRGPASILRQMLGDFGFRYSQEMVRATEPGGEVRVKGTLYRIQKKAKSK